MPVKALKKVEIMGKYTFSLFTSFLFVYTFFFGGGVIERETERHTHRERHRETERVTQREKEE